MGSKLKRWAACLTVLAFVGFHGVAWAASRIVGEDLAALAAAGTNTGTAFNVQNATSASYFVQYNGDSLEVTLKHSIDNSVWRTVAVDTLNGADSAVELLLARAVTLQGSQNANDDYFLGPVGGYLRVDLNNFDSASPCSTISVRIQYNK